MGSVLNEDNSSPRPYGLTTSVWRFMVGGRMLLDTHNRSSAMGIATGVPGVGKTVAIVRRGARLEKKRERGDAD